MPAWRAATWDDPADRGALRAGPVRRRRADLPYRRPARLRRDGQIDYLGRLDHQVKIRGFRIELGEIEARLLEQECVREAVVLAADGASGQQLLGYVVPQDVGALEGEARSLA